MVLIAAHRSKLKARPQSVKACGTSRYPVVAWSSPLGLLETDRTSDVVESERHLGHGSLCLRVLPNPRYLRAGFDCGVTGARGLEPLRMLATYRKRDGQLYFGQNLVHSGTGRLRVGERLRV
jgi:hypothetical protein